MRKAGAALLLFLLMVCAHAAAQTTPSVECFSPGLVRFAGALATQPAVHIEAQFSAEEALHVRDLSVFSEMLDGAAVIYDSVGTETTGFDRLRIARGEETLLDAGLSRDEAVLSLNGDVYAATGEDLWTALGGEGGDNPTWMAIGEMLDVIPIFERAQLEDIADVLLTLQEGDALPGGFHVARAFAIERTMSDDETRLTRIDIDGAFAREGEAPYEISGWIKQPAGRAPKDTFEISAVQDEKNQFTLYYSSTRESEIVRRDKQGEARVQTTLRSEGKLDGYRIDSRLTVRLTNKWTADEEGLDERIIITANVGHTDRTPGRKMQRLNDLAISLHAELNLHTGENGGLPIEMTDEAELSITRDELDFLSGGVTASVTLGGDPVTFPEAGGQLRAAERIPEAVTDAVQRMATRLYAQLGESGREKVEQGLMEGH